VEVTEHDAGGDAICYDCTGQHYDAQIN
jgi:hypothetical protein